MEMLKNKSVLITTQYRGVYQGVLLEFNETERSCILENANMAIRWGTSRGVDELANLGPNENSKIALSAPLIALFGITSIALCTEKAIKEWAAYKKGMNK